MSPGLIASLATTVGTPEPALRLLLSIFAGYPIAVVYRNFVIYQYNRSLHHVFFCICGVLLCIFNYGFNTYHSLISICVTYMLAHLLHHRPNLLIIINFIFQMSYLLIGYYFTESNDYDILWTMPQCVLALRMIGLGFDIADGTKPREQLSKDQVETALCKMPTLLELMGFAYFPCAFLIGPQFPFRRYQRYVEGEFIQHTGAVQAGVKRMLLGALYLIIRQVGAMLLPDDYLLTDAYRNQPLMLRLLLLGLWGRLALYKYIACWLLTEGALMSLGISYNCKDANGEPDWSGCSNVHVFLLETGYSMQHYVQSFNVNTNQWVAQYVYKRLKFLNNRTISYAAALGFLAVWHGFHSGYYMSFLIEYMIVTVEKQIATVWSQSQFDHYANIYSPPFVYTILKYVTLKTYDLIYMGWCLTPFVFLSYSRWNKVFSAVNYFGFIFVGVWLAFYQIYKIFARKAERQNQDNTFGRATTLSPTVASENNFKQD